MGRNLRRKQFTLKILFAPPHIGYWWGWFALIGLLVGAGGCRTSLRQWVAQGFKVGPEYSPPAVEVTDHWRDHQEPGIRTEEPELRQWWTVFGDPILVQLVEAAQRENLPLRIAGLRVLEARYQLGVVRGYLGPQEQMLLGAYKRTGMSKTALPFSRFAHTGMIPLWFDEWALGGQLAWELDFWGRFRRMIESAEANLQAEQEACRAALILLQAETATTYLQLRMVDERLALAEKNVQLQRDTLRIARARFEQGIVSELDVQQAQAALANTESMIPMLKTLRRVSENRLCTLLGMPPQDISEIIGPPGKIPQVPPEVVVGIPADLVRRRPDVRRAERLAAAQCARIGVAESELYPHIAITGQLAFQAEEFSYLFDGRSLAGSVSPGIRWNILHYGRLRNAIRVEDARFWQALLGYQEAVIRACEEAEGAITAFLQEQVRVRALTRATEAVEKAVQLALLQYQQGVIDFQRVLDSQRALVQQQDALAESRGKVATNLVTIYKALGGGWQGVAAIEAPQIPETPTPTPTPSRKSEHPPTKSEHPPTKLEKSANSEKSAGEKPPSEKAAEEKTPNPLREKPLPPEAAPAEIVPKLPEPPKP
ncbi:MAG: efflux transporter outer membrane subunit [Thermoguttaceae bacterium]|nr:efflux transporter outer membrane subunit [Thermoguttaceae bacterium]MDW8037912.1 efflux transporter outer membrane subunit [Thermoguttaceae bacterium]